MIPGRRLHAEFHVFMQSLVVAMADIANTSTVKPTQGEINSRKAHQENSGTPKAKSRANFHKKSNTKLGVP